MATDKSHLFTRILCPVDLDKVSLQALDTAAAVLDGAQEGCLYLLHAVSFPWALTEREAEEPFEERRYQLEKIAREHLGQRIAYQVLVTSGDASTAIMAAIERLGIDCVVMAAHHKSVMERLLLGSVAETVVREAPCPVLTIRPSLTT